MDRCSRDGNFPGAFSCLPLVLLDNEKKLKEFERI